MLQLKPWKLKHGATLNFSPKVPTWTKRVFQGIVDEYGATSAALNFFFEARSAEWFLPIAKNIVEVEINTEDKILLVLKLIALSHTRNIDGVLLYLSRLQKSVSTEHYKLSVFGIMEEMSVSVEEMLGILTRVSSDVEQAGLKERELEKSIIFQKIAWQWSNDEFKSQLFSQIQTISPLISVLQDFCAAKVADGMYEKTCIDVRDF